MAGAVWMVGSGHAAAESPTAAAEVSAIFSALTAEGGMAGTAEAVSRLEALGIGTVPAVEQYLDSPDEAQRAVALLALQRLNTQRGSADFDEAAVRHYLQLLTHSNALVRTYAMESLIRAGRRFEPLLRAHHAHAPADVQRRLTIVLGELGSG